MPKFALTLLAGALVLQWLPKLPSWPVFLALLLLALVSSIHRPFRCISIFVAGFSASGFAAALQLEDRLAPALESQTHAIIAVVDDFPVARSDTVSFVVRPDATASLPERLRLTWFEPTRIPRIGETWRLDVRLRRPGGFVNPGGFDTEGWLFRSGIGATGYVVEDGRNYRIHGVREHVVDRLRRHIAERIARLLPDDAATAVLAAIVAGARHGISKSQWDAYAATGTSHLIAISGLHVGLAAASAYLLCRGLLTLAPGARNCRDIAMIAALAAAGSYAVMSGFAVPARRALVMLTVSVALALWRRETAPSVLLGATLAVVLLADPRSVLAPGFQLSFAAVAILFATGKQVVCARVPVGARWIFAPLIRLWLVQLALLFGLLPLTVGHFDRFSAIAPAVNLLALPVFNFATVPLALAGTLFDGPLAVVGDSLLRLAQRSVELVLVLIRHAQTIDWLTFSAAIPVSPAIIVLPLLYILLPRGWPGRHLAVIAALFIVHAEPERVPGSCFDFHVLDVGQGLAVVVATRDHALLFDTGPSFRSGADTAELAILPFLSRAGIERLDIVVVSHDDLDHSGGLSTLVRGTEVGRILSGERMNGTGSASRLCTDADYWRWNAVEFRILHPRADTPWRGNNASCVLEIAAGPNRLLLTGDIESPVEILLQHRRVLRTAYAVTVPHHGSRTSSANALVHATDPEIAVVSASRTNRWGFPKRDVVDRWETAGATVLNTATSGAVSQRLCADARPGPVSEARQGRSRYWHEP